MPHLSFYAARSDFPLVLDFIFDQPGWRLVEAGSEPDQPLRYFDTTADVLGAFDLDWPGGPFRLFLPEAAGGVVERWSELTMPDRPEAKGWTHAEGWGLIVLDLRGLHDGVLRASHTNHNTEKRARNWESAYPHLGPVSAWNWDEITGASRRLNYYISRVATDRWASRRILPEAAAFRARGATLDGGFLVPNRAPDHEQ